MFRIGIIGTENSHAAGLATLFRDDPAFSDLKLVAVGGDYPESNQKMSEEFGVELIAERPEDMLGAVDAVIITARDGARHAPFARPFLEAGIPMFIDKPFTADLREAIEFAAEAKRRGVKISGGSILKYSYDVWALANEARKRGDDLEGGTVTAPVKLESPYSGFFFYSSHLVEMTLAIFGKQPIAVTARRNGDSVMAIVEYERFAVTNQFLGGCSKYSAEVFGAKEIIMRQVEYTFATRELALRFANMLRTGEMPESYEDLVRPVAYMDAVKRSYESGTTVQIPNIEL